MNRLMAFRDRSRGIFNVFRGQIACYRVQMCFVYKGEHCYMAM